MIRGLVFCVCAWGVATPATAEERVAAAPVARALPSFSIDRPARAPALGTVTPVRLPTASPKRIAAAAPASMDFTVTLHAAPTALGDFEVTNTATLGSPQSGSDLHAVAVWRITDRDPLVAGTTNGTSVVRDQMADYRKPRAFRPTALSAMLTLKIDGNADSEPFSVGGGPLAAVLWKATSQ